MMKQDIDISEASVYVGTYEKYNNGSLYGQWLDLSDYSDVSEFYEACAKLHEDEKDPEFMFQDYENIPEGLINECFISEKFFELRDAITSFDSDHLEAFFIWCDNNHSILSSADVDQLISDFEQQYVGKYKSEEDFAIEAVEQRHDLSDFALQYFDYESYANELFHSDYWFSEGHVFLH